MPGNPHAAKEIILGAGAVKPGGPRLAIDDYHVVALAEPGMPLMEGIHVRNVQQAADVVSPAFSIQYDVVLVGAEVLLRVDLI